MIRRLIHTSRKINEYFDVNKDTLDRVVFNIEMRETREKNIQKLAKLLVFGSNVYTGEEKDRNGVYEIKKN